MTTMADARRVLAEAITNGSGLRAYGYMLDSANAPCAQVFRREMDPRMVFGNTTSTYLLGVRLFAGRFAEEAAQKKLDEWTEPTGSTSVIAAIQDGGNWSVTINYAQVTGIGEQVETSLADETFLTCDLEVEVVW